MEAHNKTYYQEMLATWVQQNVRDEELDKLVEFLKEIDYSKP